MKSIFFFCAVLAVARSKPGGYYHQEYNYKSSASSYKNNELQHKNEDEGFYSKDGDLEGRVKPKVNSRSQHSEYTNPKLLGGSSNYLGTGAFGSGNYLAGSDRLFGSSQNGFQSGATDGYATSERILDLSNMYAGRTHENSQGSYGTSLGGYRASPGYGTTNTGGYGSALDGTNSYGFSQGGSRYGTWQSGTSYGSTAGTSAANVNLNSMAQRLQNEMSRQLENAVYNQYRSSGYTTSMSSTETRALEDELKRNLTRQLEESLRSQYGHQTMRGSNSYTIVEGQPSTVVNYNNQELAALTRRLEDDLIRKLHQNIRTTYNRESASSYSTSESRDQPTFVYSSTYRPVVVVPSNIRYTPIPNPESITHIATKIQTDINSYLDNALNNLYSTYVQNSGRTSYYTLTDFDNEVNRIKDEIIRNLTVNLDDQIRRNYGQQTIKGDNYYSVSSTGEISSQYNYNVRDYDNLRKQIEQNLLQKLNQTVNTYREEYRRNQSYSTNANSYTVTYRPTYYTIGSQPSGYSDVQRQLSQQLQNALNQHRYSQSSSYSSSSSYNPQAYQTSLDELSRELQRNLTEQMRTLRAQSSSSSSGYGYIAGSGTNGADFESMKNQLQNQLMQQLQQGLQKQYHYSARASYSASSSSSGNANYGTHQSYGNPGNYMECCQGDDPSVYTQVRHKRGLYLHHQRPYGSHSHRGYSSKSNLYLSPWNHHSQFSQHNHFQSNQDQSINGDYFQRGRLEQSDDDLDQQIQLSDNYQERNNDQQVSSQLQDDLDQKLSNQRLEDQDLTQQLELDTPIGKLQLEQKPVKLNIDQQISSQLRDNLDQVLSNQRLEDQDLTQQLELDSPIGKLQLEQQQQKPEQQNNGPNVSSQLRDSLDQELSNQDLTQQLELDLPTGKLQLEQKQNNDQQVSSQLRDNLDLALSNQRSEDQDLTQQLELDSPIGNLHLEQQQKPEEQNTDQQVLPQLQDYLEQKLSNQGLEDQELTQQLENDAPTSHLQLTQHVQKPEAQITLNNAEKNEKLEQQLNQDVFPSLGVVNLQRQKYYNRLDLPGQQIQNQNQLQEDLTQQTEEDSETSLNHKVSQKLELRPEDDSPTQQLQIDNKRNSSPHQVQEEENLGQQIETTNSRVPSYSRQQYRDQDQSELNIPKMYQQNLEDQTDTDQQLELSSKLKTSIAPQIQETQQIQDLSQQLENHDDLTQQLETHPDQDQKLSTEQKIREVQTSQNLVEDQQLENDDSAQLQLTNSENLENLSQQITKQEVETPITRKHAQKLFQEQYHGNKPNDDTQQLELIQSNIPESKKHQTSSDQEVDLTQKLEPIDNQKPDRRQGKPENNQEKHTEINSDQSPKNLDEQLETQEQQHSDDYLQAMKLVEQFLQNEKQHDPNPSHKTDQVLEDVSNLQLESTENDKKSKKIPRGEELEHVTEQKLLDQQIQLTADLMAPKSIPEGTNQQLELAAGLNLKKLKNQETIDQQTVTDCPHSGTYHSGSTLYSSINPGSNVITTNNEDQQLELSNGLSLTQHKNQDRSDSIDQQTLRKHHQWGTYHSHSSHIPTQEISESRNQQVIGSYVNQEPSEYLPNFETAERLFTNGHSNHITHPSQSQESTSSYERALEQQNALINLLKQKVDSKLAISGHQTTFPDRESVSIPQNTQYSIADTGIKEIKYTKHSDQFPQTTRVIHGGFPELRGTSGKTYSGNAMEISQWNPYPRNMIDGTSQLSSNPIGGYHSQFTQKTTKRTYHFVNGKPVSASENVQVLQPNGEIVESHHDLPLDSNLLKSYSNGFSSNPMAVNFNQHALPEKLVTNYGMNVKVLQPNERIFENHHDSTLNNDLLEGYSFHNFHQPPPRGELVNYGMQSLGHSYHTSSRSILNSQESGIRNSGTEFIQSSQEVEPIIRRTKGH